MTGRNARPTNSMKSIRYAIAGTIFTAIVGLIVLGSAGRVDLPFVWVCLFIQAGFWLVMPLLVPAELLRERTKPPREGRVHDYHRALAVPLLVGSWFLVGFDLGRWHISDTVPTALRIIGSVGYAFSLAGAAWAMSTNRFYSSVIRLQRDRGHEVIDTGPYRFVRHPGYAATIMAFLTGGLAMGSWLAMIPMLLIALLFVRRVINEDQMLQRELEGYEEYAQRTRWRVVPGVW